MNSKPVILTAFVIWAVICGRWYVCGIKDACKEKSPVVEVIQTPAIEPDTADLNIPPAVPVDPQGQKKDQPDTKSAPVTPDKMDNVQMERVEDRMVIHFPYKSWRKEDDAAIDAYLSELARQLISSGEKVRITGHTDFVGEPKENYNFGLRRANSIRDILVKKGVSPKQIICKSSGDTRPVATNDTPYGRYLNRRVEIRTGK
ncbi:MAG: OmpA family protein [Saprospiraceae bacterium]|nr:OmpA family protein [Saprospiraceae bacterium]